MVSSTNEAEELQDVIFCLTIVFSACDVRFAVRQYSTTRQARALVSQNMQQLLARVCSMSSRRLAMFNLAVR